MRLVLMGEKPRGPILSALRSFTEPARETRGPILSTLRSSQN